MGLEQPHPTSHTAEIPVLWLRVRLFPIRYYVFARWKDGREAKIARFRDKSDALGFIRNRIPDWAE